MLVIGVHLQIENMTVTALTPSIGLVLYPSFSYLLCPSRVKTLDVLFGQRVQHEHLQEVAGQKLLQNLAPLRTFFSCQTSTARGIIIIFFFSIIIL